jgi:hypothetical protein
MGDLTISDYPIISCNDLPDDLGARYRFACGEVAAGWRLSEGVRVVVEVTLKWVGGAFVRLTGGFCKGRPEGGVAVTLRQSQVIEKSPLEVK